MLDKQYKDRLVADHSFKIGCWTRTKLLDVYSTLCDKSGIDFDKTLDTAAIRTIILTHYSYQIDVLSENAVEIIEELFVKLDEAAEEDDYYNCAC